MARKKNDTNEETEVDETPEAPKADPVAKSDNAGAKQHPRMEKFLLGDTLKAIAKKHGISVIKRASEHHASKTHFIHSGALAMDWVLGGGYRVGGIHTLWGSKSAGKTTSLLKMIATAQQQCANCWEFASFNDEKTGEVHATPKCTCGKYREVVVAFIDTEGTWDAAWAKVLGVDTDRMLLTEPEYAEQSLDIAEALLRDGNIDILVLDSIAFLSPEKEVEESNSKETMGVQPRVIGKGIRKFVAALNNAGNTTGRKPTLFFTNQVRMKLGVMFGCFSYNSLVHLADGTKLPIGKIVKDKMPVEVLSLNTATGQMEPKKIVNWFNNGHTDEFLRFSLESTGGSRNSARMFSVTPNHKILTPDGERSAGDLAPGDEVLGAGLLQLTPVMREVALGSVLGDGSLRKTGRHAVSLRIGQGRYQVDYGRWKASLFEDCVRWAGPTGREGWGFDLRPSSDLVSVYKESYPSKGVRTLSKQLLSELTLRALAIWYMDGGSFDGSYEKWGNGKVTISAISYTLDECITLADTLAGLGLPRPTVAARNRLMWSGEDCRKFQTLLAPFVHPIMDFKLHPSLRGRYEPYPTIERTDRQMAVPIKILDIYPDFHQGDRFDLEVEGNHTYVVAGAVVHNSPETMPGGQAPQFAATTELKFKTAKYEIEKDGDRESHEVNLSLVKPISVLFAFKSEKNKQGTPQMEGAYRMAMVNTETRKKGDVCDEDVLMTEAERYEVVKKEGSKWTCAGVPFDTKGAITDALVTNPQFKRMLSKQILTCLGAE